MFANGWHFLVAGSGHAEQAWLFALSMALMPAFVVAVAMLWLPAVQQEMSAGYRQWSGRRQKLAAQSARHSRLPAFARLLPCLPFLAGKAGFAVRPSRPAAALIWRQWRCTKALLSLTKLYLD